jgi:hypothetical protein
MNTSTEWNELIRIWQQPAEAGADPRDIRGRVVSDSRRESLLLAAEYAVGAIIVCLVAWKLATDKGLDTFVWGFAMLWFTAMALQFTSTNRRGLWAPSGDSTLAYVDLALERLRRRERAVRFAWLLFGLQLAFLLAWYPATWFLWPQEAWPLLERTPAMLGWLALVALALAGWTASTHSRNASARAEFERLRAELTAAA